MPMTVQQLCDEAIRRHQSGDLAEAERLGLRALSLDPRNLAAGYLIGVIRFQQGRHDEAVVRIGDAVDGGLDQAETNALYGLALQAAGRLEDAEARLGRAVALKPDHLMAHYNRGGVLLDLQRPQEAVDSYDRALKAHPSFAEAWTNRGLALQELKRLDDALASFDQALAVRPDYAEGWVNRGVALKDLERPEEALESFDKALAMRPDLAEAWNGRGFIQHRLQRLEAAQESFEQALALAPGYAEAQFNLASVLCARDRIAEGYAGFMRCAQLHEAGRARAPASLPHKLKHDQEQKAYLAQANPAAMADRLHLEGGDRLAGPAVNGGLASDIDTQWRTNQPQVVVIDDFLTPEALNALRRFCWGSTIWQGVYDNGYLGAMAEHGLACPLLAQISEELRDAYPAIFEGHPLNYVWAFKYDSQLDGIELHADRAAVNVNFWITPDEANLDPTSGGLVIWDVAAPADWDYGAYNADPAASRRFLEDAGARTTTVPYRANRAVVFDSDLFHKTDRIAFKDGYLNRRINVTLLYGRRSADNR